MLFPITDSPTWLYEMMADSEVAGTPAKAVALYELLPQLVIVFPLPADPIILSESKLLEKEAQANDIPKFTLLIVLLMTLLKLFNPAMDVDVEEAAGVVSAWCELE